MVENNEQVIRRDVRWALSAMKAALPSVLQGGTRTMRRTSPSRRSPAGRRLSDEGSLPLDEGRCPVVAAKLRMASHACTARLPIVAAHLSGSTRATSFRPAISSSLLRRCLSRQCHHATIAEGIFGGIRPCQDICKKCKELDMKAEVQDEKFSNFARTFIEFGVKPTLQEDWVGVPCPSTHSAAVNILAETSLFCFSSYGTYRRKSM